MLSLHTNILNMDCFFSRSFESFRAFVARLLQLLLLFHDRSMSDFGLCPLCLMLVNFMFLQRDFTFFFHSRQKGNKAERNERTNKTTNRQPFSLLCAHALAIDMMCFFFFFHIDVRFIVSKQSGNI